MSNHDETNERIVIWKNIVYRLVYPGVLGSMIFDLFDPLRPISFMKCALLLVAVTFMVDYYHISILKFSKRPDARPLIDSQIAVLYCFAYFALSSTTSKYLIDDRVVKHMAAGLGFLFLAHVQIFYYDYTLRISTELLSEKAVPAILFLLGALTTVIQSNASKLTVIAWILGGTIFYCWHVFKYEPPQTEQKVRRDYDMVMTAISAVAIAVWLVWAKNSIVIPAKG